MWPACGSEGVRCRALVGASDVAEGAALDAVGRPCLFPIRCVRSERKRHGNEGERERDRERPQGERERGSLVKRCSFVPFASSVSSREERGIDSGEGERETE